MASVTGPQRNVATTRELVLTFHNIFTLDGNELGCMSAIEHEILVNDSEPFKERFLVHSSATSGGGVHLTQ